jgi:hypothetical protein
MSAREAAARVRQALPLAHSVLMIFGKREPTNPRANINPAVS